MRSWWRNSWYDSCTAYWRHYTSTFQPITVRIILVCSRFNRVTGYGIRKSQRFMYSLEFILRINRSIRIFFETVVSAIPQSHGVGNPDGDVKLKFMLYFDPRTYINNSESELCAVLYCAVLCKMLTRLATLSSTRHHYLIELVNVHQLYSISSPGLGHTV